MFYNNNNNFKVNFTSDIQHIKARHYLKVEPYLCMVCERVWQLKIGYCGPYRKANSAEYLSGFPKYGCSKNTCIRCKKGL